MAKPSVEVPARCYTIDQFCIAHQISRSTWYELVKRGTAPVTYKIFERTYVSIEAANAWRIDRERVGRGLAPLHSAGDAHAS